LLYSLPMAALIRPPQDCGFSSRSACRAIWPRITEAAIDAAIAGFGVTRVLSYQVAEAVRTGALRLALESFEPAAWPVSLVRPERGRLPLKLRAFLDLAAPRLKARLAFA